MLKLALQAGPSAIRAALIGLAWASVGAALAGPPSITEFEVDRPFPTIELPYLQQDGSGSILDFAGKKTVLHVFASW